MVVAWQSRAGRAEVTRDGRAPTLHFTEGHAAALILWENNGGDRVTRLRVPSDRDPEAMTWVSPAERKSVQRRGILQKSKSGIGGTWDNQRLAPQWAQLRGSY